MVAIFILSPLECYALSAGKQVVTFQRFIVNIFQLELCNAPEDLNLREHITLA